MAKNLVYYCGDALTKIGAGLFAGSAVGLYYNSGLNPAQMKIILWNYTVLTFVFGALFIAIGYTLMSRNDN